MKKKKIRKTLKALKNFCKTKESCRDCKLFYSCFFNSFPCESTNKDIKLIANVLKDFYR